MAVEPRLAAVVLVLSELFMLCPVKMCYEPGNNYSASIYTVTDPGEPRPPIFGRNCLPPPPPFLRVWMTGNPPSLLIWRFGSGTVIFQVKTTLSLTVLTPSIRLRRFSFRDTELKQWRRQRQREPQKKNSTDRFKLAAQRLCTCITTLFYISLPSWDDCDVKPPYFTFYGGHENEITIFFSFFWSWTRSFGKIPPPPQHLTNRAR